MDANSFAEGLLTGYALELLSILGLGMAALVGFLKVRFRPTGTNILWGDVFLFGLLSLAAVSVILFVFTGHGVLFKQPDPITSENVKSRVLDWVRSMGQSASNDGVHPEQINLFIHQSPIIVSVADGYLRVQFNLHSSEQQNVIAKLKPDQQNNLAHKMEVQLLDLGLQSFTFLDFPEILAAGYTDIPISERMTQESARNGINRY